jgi:hypothetical protein
MDWIKMRDALLPIIALVILGAVGIVAMVLAGQYPENDWYERIAFFVFGSATSPIHNIFSYLKGNKKSAREMVAKGLLIGTMVSALTAIGCSRVPVTMEDSTAYVLYKDGKPCIKLETKICYKSNSDFQQALEKADIIDGKCLLND